MLYVFSGSDELSLRDALDAIKRTIGSGTELEMNTAVLEGRQVNMDELRSACETMPFMAPKRLVIITGLIARFTESRERKPAKQAKPWEPIAAYLNSIPEFTVAVLIEDQTPGGPFFDAIAGKAELKRFNPLSGAQLAEWVRTRISAAHGKINEPALIELMRRVGGNLFTMTGEIQKLVAYAGSQTITREDIVALVPDTQESSIFNLVDAILDYRADFAENILAEFLERGESPVYLLTMILRQASFIVRARDLMDRKLPRPQIQGRLGLSDFPFRKTLEQAERYSLPRMKQFYRQLLETDMAIKTGKFSGEFALNILIAELARR